MPTPSEDRVRMVGEAIVRYLESHPDAADTARGIQQWWLLDAAADIGRGELCAALDALVREGTVRRETLPGGTHVYSRAGPSGPQS